MDLLQVYTPHRIIGYRLSVDASRRVDRAFIEGHAVTLRLVNGPAGYRAELIDDGAADRPEGRD